MGPGPRVPKFYTRLRFARCGLKLSSFSNATGPSAFSRSGTEVIRFCRHLDSKGFDFVCFPVYQRIITPPTKDPDDATGA